MTKSDKSDKLKKRLLESLETFHGIVSSACKECKCSRDTFYRYVKDDKEFSKHVDDISNTALDFVEGKLFDKVESGDTTAIIFYLKTKGKKRGYIETNKFEISTSDDMEIELPPEVKRSTRKKKKA